MSTEDDPSVSKLEEVTTLLQYGNECSLEEKETNDVMLDVLVRIRNIMQANLDLAEKALLDAGRDQTSPKSKPGDEEEPEDGFKLEMPKTVKDKMFGLSGLMIGLIGGFVKGMWSQFAIINKFMDSKLFGGVFGKLFSNLTKNFRKVFKAVKGAIWYIRLLSDKGKGISNFSKNMKMISTFFTTTLGKITQPIRAIFDPLTKLFGSGSTNKLFEPVRKILGQAGKFFKMFRQFGSALGQTLGKLFVVIRWVIAIWKGITTALDDFKMTDGNIVQKVIAGLFGFVKGFLQSFFGTFIDFIKDGLSWILKKVFGEDNPVSKFLDSFSVVDMIGTVLDGIRDFFIVDIPNAFAFLIDNFFTILIDNVLFRVPMMLKNAVSWITKKIFGEDNAFSSALDGFTFSGFFSDIIDGFANFIKVTLPNAVYSVFDMFLDGLFLIPNIIKDGFSAIAKQIFGEDNAFSKLLDDLSFKDVFRALTDSILDFFMNVVPEAVGKLWNGVKSWFGFGSDEKPTQEKVKGLDIADGPAREEALTLGEDGVTDIKAEAKGGKLVSGTVTQDGNTRDITQEELSKYIGMGKYTDQQLLKKLGKIDDRYRDPDKRSRYRDKGERRDIIEELKLRGINTDGNYIEDVEEQAERQIMDEQNEWDNDRPSLPPTAIATGADTPAESLTKAELEGMSVDELDDVIHGFDPVGAERAREVMNKKLESVGAHAIARDPEKIGTGTIATALNPAPTQPMMLIDAGNASPKSGALVGGSQSAAITGDYMQGATKSLNNTKGEQNVASNTNVVSAPSSSVVNNSSSVTQAAQPASSDSTDRTFRSSPMKR